MSSCAKLSASNTAGKAQITPAGDGLPNVAVSSTSIQGSWASGCTTGYDSSGNKTYTTSKLTLTANSLETDNIVYADATCDSPYTEEARVNSYSVVTADTTIIETAFVSTSITPLNSFASSMENQSKYCGYADWVAGVSKPMVAADLANCANYGGVTQTFNSRLFGGKELYLDNCPLNSDGTTDTSGKNCTVLRYTRTSL